MNRLLNLTSETRQSKTYLFRNEDITIELYYSEINIGWYITIIYGDFKLENARLTASKNFLNYFRRKLKWGLRVESRDGIDPVNINDFSSDRIKLYFLTPNEVEYVTNIDYRYNSEIVYNVA